jgi:hypothetical protein
MPMDRAAALAGGVVYNLVRVNGISDRVGNFPFFA